MYCDRAEIFSKLHVNRCFSGLVVIIRRKSQENARVEEYYYFMYPGQFTLDVCVI